MDVSLTDEQRMLVASVRRLADDAAGSAVDVAPGQLPATDSLAWHHVVDMDLPGLRSRSTDGSKTTGTVEAVLAVEAVARSLTRVPLLGTLLATDLLMELPASPELDEVLTRGRAASVVVSDDLVGLAVSGLAWDCADGGLVVAVDGDQLLLAELGEPVPAADLTRQVATATAEPGARGMGWLGEAALVRWEALALALVSADIVGTLTGALATAVDHVKTREQFGRPVGGFQAVQQIAAEQHVLVEAARSAVWHAGWAVDELAPGNALTAAMTAKAFCSEIARDVAEATIQMWGGIGMTWECPAHLFLRRALMDRQLFGDEGRQLDALADARLGPVQR
jgi:alkylation response protein AidB-like acyl-CoA dehydrogenase